VCSASEIGSNIDSPGILHTSCTLFFVDNLPSVLPAVVATGLGLRPIAPALLLKQASNRAIPFGRWAIRVLRPSGAGRPCYPKTPTPAPEGRKTEIALRVRVARDSRKPQRPRPSGAIALNARGFGRARTKGFGRRPSGVARPMAHEKALRQRFMKVRVRYETR
jgi:hypothetical protein